MPVAYERLPAVYSARITETINCQDYQVDFYDGVRFCRETTKAKRSSVTGYINSLLGSLVNFGIYHSRAYPGISKCSFHTMSNNFVLFFSKLSEYDVSKNKG
jgi:hypothetical protein